MSQAKDEKKNVSSANNEIVEKKVIQSTECLVETSNLEQLQKLQQQVTAVYSECEHENDDRVSKMQRDVIDKAVASILEAERKNDQMVNEVINAIPKSARSTKEAADATNVLKILSEKLASELK